MTQGIILRVADQLVAGSVAGRSNEIIMLFHCGPFLGGLQESFTCSRWPARRQRRTGHHVGLRVGETTLALLNCILGFGIHQHMAQ